MFLSVKKKKKKVRSFLRSDSSRRCGGGGTFLGPPLVRSAAPQVEPEHALAVQPQQEAELVRHGVDLHFGLPVVVVVVRQVQEGVRVDPEGPEPVQVHVVAELQRQAGHDEARAEPRGPQALRAPEHGQTLEVPRVKEDGPDGTPKVLDGVESPEGDGGVAAVGEGGKEQHGVAVAVQILYERAAASIQSRVPANTKPMRGNPTKKLLLGLVEELGIINILPVVDTF